MTFIGSIFAVLFIVSLFISVGGILIKIQPRCEDGMWAVSLIMMVVGGATLFCVSLMLICGFPSVCQARHMLNLEKSIVRLESGVPDVVGVEESATLKEALARSKERFQKDYLQEMVRMSPSDWEAYETLKKNEEERNE